MIESEWRRRIWKLREILKKVLSLGDSQGLGITLSELEL